MERRALYHSLRVNWQLDPTLAVEPWQVEDYRKLTSEQLFSRLGHLGVRLDYAHFIALAESEETPEDFAEALLPDHVEDPEIADKIYLIVFELWRRFLSERQTLSLFCDEWDHQIDLYEEGLLETQEGLDDSIGRCISFLEEIEDQGEAPKALYESVLQGCAHDIEAFLYDFAKTQIEERNISYAEEIVEAFLPVAREKKWFNLLKMEILSKKEPESSLRLIHQALKECQTQKDLEFNLEFFAFLAEYGDEKAFLQLFKLLVPELQIEEDFWDLLSSCESYFHYKDADSKEEWVKSLRARRFKNDPNQPFSKEEPELKNLQKLF